MHHIFAFPPFITRLWLLMALTLLASSATGLDLYRCSRDGEVEFRQTPCPAGEQTLTKVIEQSGGISPVEPALRLPQRKIPKSTTQASSGQGNEERCWKTRQRLERVERRLRGGYKASQYESLHRKQEEYADYLRRFCKG